MSLVVSAHITQNGVFFAGEKLHCVLKIEHLNANSFQKKDTHSNFLADADENICSIVLPISDENGADADEDFVEDAAQVSADKSETASLKENSEEDEKQNSAARIHVAYAQLEAEMELNGTFFHKKLFEPLTSSLSVIKKNGLSGGFFNGAFKRLGVSNVFHIPIATCPVVEVLNDARIASGQQHHYRFSMVLPKTLPTSFVGKSAKVSYTLLFGVHREGYQPILLEMNFRVFSFLTGIFRSTAFIFFCF